MEEGEALVYDMDLPIGGWEDTANAEDNVEAVQTVDTVETVETVDTVDTVEAVDRTVPALTMFSARRELLPDH